MAQIVECMDFNCDNYKDGKCTLDRVRMVVREHELVCEDADERVIKAVKFNNELPDNHDYKYFDVVLEDGEVKTFHHHKNNPIPAEEEILGLTWEELRELCLEKWHEAIKA